MPAPIPGIRLRYWLLAFGLAVILPLVGFSIFSIGRDYLRETEASDVAIQRHGIVLGLVVGEHLEIIEHKAVAIALSPEAQNGDLRRLYDYASRVQRSSPYVMAYGLVDVTGRLLFVTNRPFGETIGLVANPEDIHKVFATGKRNATDFFVSVKSRVKVAALDVPVLRDGKVIYVLRSLISTDSLTTLLEKQTVRAGWAASIIDSQGVRLARIPRDDALIGVLPPPVIQEAIRRGQRGLFDARMLATQADSRALITPVPGWNWAIAINAPKADLYARTRSDVLELIGVVAVILLATLVFSIAITRRGDLEFRRAMTRGLALPAPGQGKSRPSVIAEANELAARLQEAGEWRTMVTALECADNAMVITDAEARVEWCNAAFSTLSGYAHDEILGQPLGQLIRSGQQDEGFYRSMWATIGSGQVWRGEIINRRKDGSLYPEYQTITPVIDAAGRVFRYIAIKMDVSEHKAREVHLQATLQTLQIANKVAKNGIWDWHLADKSMIWDEQMFDMFGVPAAERDTAPSYATWASRIHPDDLAVVEDALRRVREQPGDHSVVFRLLRPDGSLRYIEAAAFVARDAEGRPLRMIGVNHDVTALREAENHLRELNASLERKVAERTHELAGLAGELQQSEERFQLAMDAAAEGIWDWNLATGEMYFSPGYATMLGYAPAELSKDISTWSRLLDPGEPVSTIDTARQLLRDQGQYALEFRVRHRDGGYRWVLSRGKVVARDAAGAPLRAVGTHVDITELRQARQEAERLAGAKSEFLANMSHEIRTPLNGVIGMARLGVRESAGSALQKRFAQIIDSGQLLLTVINDVLDFSKMEAGKLEVEQVAFDPARVAATAVDTLHGLADGKGLALACVADGLPAACLGDPLRISQVLLNLLSNAVKFTSQGEVRLRAGCEADELVFSVSDTGVGIAGDDQERLFLAFEQGDTSTTRKFGGTGLGLAISRRLAQLMGGSLDASSVVGQGSTFTLRLPLRLADRRVIADDVATAGSGGKRLTGLRILVAEDNDVNQLVLADYLAQEGAVAVLTGNGQEALDAVAAAEPGFDAVLMDVQLPVLDGLQATQRLRQSHPQLPVIGQTAHALTEERDRCRASGMVDVLTKPLDADVMVAAILRQIGRATPPVAPSASAPEQAGATLEAVAEDRCAGDVIDWVALERGFHTRPELVMRLLQSGLNGHAGDAVHLRDMAAAGDVDAIGKLAHGIKGFAGYLRAGEARALATATNEAARGGRPDAVELAGQLADAMDRLIDALRQRLAEDAPAR